MVVHHGRPNIKGVLMVQQALRPEYKLREKGQAKENLELLNSTP
jgi:hypothetical protein